jgi:hypothetical protein
MRRVLIISPHFPPVNAADHQRVRMSLPYLKDFGWQPTILAVRPERLEGMPVDPLLAETVPAETKITTVEAIPASITRLVGLGNLALRSLPFLWRAGNALMTRTKFDLVFFSTTQFAVMILGPTWEKKFGIPYVVDFQDPWLDDYYERTGTPPPGGKLRNRLSRFLARKWEPKVMRRVSQVVAVSPAYVATLAERYRHLKPDRFTTLPFGAPERDFQLLESMGSRQEVLKSVDGRRNLVYVGRGGGDMNVALRILFRAVGEARKSEPRKWSRVRLHFVGTSYAPAGKGQKSVVPVAAASGVADLVDEQTNRVGYFDALHILTQADGLLVIGSDSPSYTPSKIYPYVLARRPLLSIVHARSSASEIVRRTRAGILVTFDDNGLSEGQVSPSVGLEKFLDQIVTQETPDVDWAAFGQYSAREMTRRLCEVFDQAAIPSPPGPTAE